MTSTRGRASLLVAWVFCAQWACGADASQPPCTAPLLVPTDLIVADGSLDRGFPGGVSLADVDGDGDLDLMATRGYDTTPQNKPFKYDRSMLYLNDGKGGFTHAVDSPLSNADGPGSGSTWGDVDGDGDLDAFVSLQHQKPDFFYRNLGAGRFAREELGEATQVKSSNFTSSWVDIDGDGDLDLFVGGPTLELPATNLAYRNDAGRFVRVEGLPIQNGASNPGAVLWADFDGDGDQDLFVANSDVARESKVEPAAYETSQLYRNEGGWQFSRMEGQGFSDKRFPANVAAVGDIDGDGDLDLFLGAHSGTGNRSFSDYLFRNNGRGRFTLDAGFIGPPHKDMAGGATFADYDLDGDLDLLFGNFNTGIYYSSNDGTGRFTPVPMPALNDRVNSHGAFASGDLDGDGDIDTVVGNWGDTHEGEFVTIIRNDGPMCGTPLRLELRDSHGAPDPIGARVTLVTKGPAGERHQLREAMGQTGFRAQSGSTFLFGLPRSERFVRLDIRWPEGVIQRVTRVDASRPVLIRARPTP